MKEIFVATGTVTYAMRAREILAKNGVFADVKKCTDMIIIKAVKNGFSIPPGLHQSDMPEMFQMMRNSRLCHLQDFCEIAHA